MVINEQTVNSKPFPKSNWRTVGVKVREEDLGTFNKRLSLYGYETLGQLVSDFIAAKFPIVTEDRQINAIGDNIQNSGLKTVISASKSTGTLGHTIYTFSNTRSKNTIVARVIGTWC